MSWQTACPSLTSPAGPNWVNSSACAWLGAGNDVANAVAVQPDGKIVVAGYIPAGDFTLARYTSAGQLDAGFGKRGKAKLDGITSQGATPRAIVPANEQHKIAAELGRLAYVPTWVPSGYVFINWKATPPRGLRTGSILWGNLQIDFARAGASLLWNVIWPTQAPD